MGKNRSTKCLGDTDLEDPMDLLPERSDTALLRVQTWAIDSPHGTKVSQSDAESAALTGTADCPLAHPTWARVCSRRPWT